jgi:hypothetical protein
MKNQSLTSLVIGSSILMAAVQPALAQSSAAVDVNKLQARIEQLQHDAEDFLDRHAVAYSQIPNFKLSGEVTGSLEGKIKLKSPLGLTVLGTAIGLMGPALFLSGTGVPFMSTALINSLAGPAAGAALGAAGDMIRGGGSGYIRGELNGSISGEGWDNLDSPKFFGLMVIDTHAHEKLRQNFNIFNNGSNIDPENLNQAKCTENYVEALQEIRNKGKFATVDEARQLQNLLKEYRSLVRELKSARFSLAPVREKSVMDAVASYEGWLKKRISIMYLNPGDMAIGRFSSRKLSLSRTLLIDGKYPLLSSVHHFNKNASDAAIKSYVATTGVPVPLSIDKYKIQTGKLSNDKLSTGFLANPILAKLEDVTTIEFGPIASLNGTVLRGTNQRLPGPELKDRCNDLGEFLITNSKSTEIFFSQNMDAQFLRRSILRSYSN